MFPTGDEGTEDAARRVVVPYGALAPVPCGGRVIPFV